PRISPEDAAVVRDAIPEAVAVSLQSGFPTPRVDITSGSETLGDVLIFGTTPDYQVVQDYRFTSGRALIEVDVRERRPVAVIGADVATKLFANVDPIGRDLRVRNQHFEVVGVVAPKGRVLGQSFD